MVKVEPKKSMNKTTVILIAAVVVCLIAVVAILIVSGGPHKQPNLLTLVIAGNNESSNDKISATTSVLRERFIALDYDASVSQIVDNNGRAFIYVFYGNISTDRVTAIATTPGHVEMRIQTAGNESVPVLYNSDFKTASCTGEGRSTLAGVSLFLTPDGAATFRQKCIEVNVTGDPFNHRIITILDGQIISAVPLTDALASKLASGPVDNIILSMGTGSENFTKAGELCAAIAGDELPVPLKVAGM